MVQKRLRPTPATALGKGKLSELIERVEANAADVVIFDNELALRQIRELELAVGRKVIDRTELILDIFASRARSKEAQMQVELAQLQYTAPRLRGLWTHLERIAGAGGGTGAGIVGGVGTRGPGERQIEIDRRIVRDRISHLKREIRQIDERKRREVQARKDHFTVSLVGYTNSGKSTLMNRMTGADQLVADMLFATLDTKTARWPLQDGQSALLSDTVGFVRDLPTDLVASFRATLEETIHADLLLHVVDASSPQAWHQIEAVEAVLKSLECDTYPRILVLNKIDRTEPGVISEIQAIRGDETIPLSARLGDGVDRLVEEVSRRVKGTTLAATVRIPHAEGKLLAQIDRLASVHARRYTSDGVELDLRMNREQLLQLRGRFPAMHVVGATDAGTGSTGND
jgi:GTP-binding protein HflX